jgi:hypothetical protein
MHVPLGGDPVADLRPDGRIISPNGILPEGVEEVAQDKEIWKSPIPDKRLKMDGWMAHDTVFLAAFDTATCYCLVH